jgi:bisphosphoglycerate-dependent phosphoglycerate mutase
MILLKTTGPSRAFYSQGGIVRARPTEVHPLLSMFMRTSCAGAVASGKWRSSLRCAVRAQVTSRAWGTTSHLHHIFHQQQQQQQQRRRNLCSVRASAPQSESPSSPAGRRASDSTSTSSSSAEARSSPGAVAAAAATTTTASANQQLPPVPRHAHRVVLMRHGESEFNNANIFTGWCDVALTPRGVVEAVEAGEVFRSLAVSFRKCYTSLLTRSIITAHRCLEAAGVAYTPLMYDWRFNERHYGSLQGLGKDRTADRLGRDIVMEWRRSYSARPPPMTEEHPHYWILLNDDRYRTLKGSIPLTESLVRVSRSVMICFVCPPPAALPSRPNYDRNRSKTARSG